MAAGDRGRTRAAAYEHGEDGSWAERCNSDEALEAFGREGYVTACLTPQGGLLCNVAESEGSGTATYLIDGDGFAEAPGTFADSPLSSLRFCEDGEVLALGIDGLSLFDAETGGRVRSFQLKAGEYVSDFTVHDGAVAAVVTSTMRSEIEVRFASFDLRTGERDGRTDLLETLEHAVPPTYEKGVSAPPVLASGPDALYACTSEGVYRCADGRAMRVFSGENTRLANAGQTVQRLLAHPDGGFLVQYADSTSEDRPASLYRYAE